MASRSYPKIATGLFITLSAISFLFSTRLLLVEYLRFLIYGMGLAIVFLSMRTTFLRRYVTLCMLAGGYAYMVHALDPAVSGVALFSTPAPAFNTYRVISLTIVATAAVWWLKRDVRAAGSWSEWLAALEPRHRYALGILLLGGVLLTMLEILRAFDTQTSVMQAILRGTKWIDWACIYLAIVCGLGSEPVEESAAPPPYVLYALLTFCGAVTLVGGLRATDAYYQARLPSKLDVLQGRRRLQLLLNTVTPREQLLRVFSLNSHEALLVFEAGYYAGLQDREKYRARMRQLERYPRPGLQEIDAMEALADGNYATAVRVLEQFPLDYQFSVLNRERAQEIIAQLAWAEAGSVADYVRALLLLRCGDPTNAAVYFAAYAQRATNHANAAYFAHATGGLTNAFPSVTYMPAAGWLSSLSPGKPLQEHGQYVTLLYNLTARGIVWLPTGTYTVTVWARDEGTPLEAARASGFDPTCKCFIIFGNSTAFFTVLSTNRNFVPCTLTAEISALPDRVLIEFVNDHSDTTRGWDRNLAISHIEFHRQTPP